ncbi:MAG TPA: AAA family ATPase, partial [Actinobacteria bacterium]|nr:AAA family ATPase [Actinomycetes bacterium]HEX21270.1 AAA family ATPase [Actinomycetota bacterium]
SEGPKKVYIIDEVHMLTNEAFNALLKLLEEPPAHIIFILATTEPSKVLPTIISRCQRFDFRPILFSDLVKQLKKVAKAEKIKVEDEAFELIAKEARGGLRDGLGILDQLASYTSKEIKATDVIGLLGLVAGEKINRLIDIIISGAAGEIFTFTNDLIVEGVNLRQFTKELVDYGRNIFIIQNGGADKLINATTEEIETLKVHAKNLSKAQTRRLLNIFSQALTEMKNISDPQFILEMSCVKLMTPAADDDTDALRERLEKLERQLDNSHISVIPAPRETKKVTVKKIAPAKVVTDDEKITPKKVINKSRATSAGNMSLREVERFWPTIMAKIKGLSLPTHAILMECRPISVDNGKFIIDAGTDWRQELLKKPTKTAALKTALKNILGKDLNLVITVGAETNKNKVKPAATESPASALIEADDAVDDENLTLGLIKNSFGAEIVSEKNDTE